MPSGKEEPRAHLRQGKLGVLQAAEERGGGRFRGVVVPGEEMAGGGEGRLKRKEEAGESRARTKGAEVSETREKDGMRRRRKEKGLGRDDKKRETKRDSRTLKRSATLSERRGTEGGPRVGHDPVKGDARLTAVGSSRVRWARRSPTWVRQRHASERGRGSEPGECRPASQKPKSERERRWR